MANDMNTAHPLDGLLDYPAFVRAMVDDLKALRSGKITVAQARARGEMAKQIVRAVAVGLDAQKLIMDGAKRIPALDQPKDGAP